MQGGETLRIEIFVVLTEQKKLCDVIGHSELIDIQNKIAKKFGGLSIIPNVKGLWIDNTSGICEDSNEIWLIYAHHKESVAIIEAFAKQIKKITYQQSQAFGIDGKLYLV
jgi:hypothetical protein